MQFTTLFIDLDDTLYPGDNGLWLAIKTRIQTYMHEQLGLPLEAVPALSRQYFLEYGTTLRGLQANYHVNTEHYLAYVHDVPLDEYLAPNPALGAILQSIPARKWIFTNADVHHARRVLRALELGQHFEGIIDVLALTPYCKPMPQAFDIAQQRAAEPDPRRCVMIDDLPHTIRAARQQGFCGLFYTCPGGHAAAQHPDADATFTDWALLPALLNGREHAPR